MAALDDSAGVAQRVAGGRRLGHDFNHGPADGRYAAQLLNGARSELEPRSGLAAKAARQQRAVH